MDSPILRDLHACADKDLATFQQKFFKTQTGGYGEGDQFLGITVPKTRSIAKQYSSMDLQEIAELLQSPWHEARLTALHLLEHAYTKGGPEQRKDVVKTYLQHVSFVNNWDLVDTSAHKILGRYVWETGKTDLLWALAESEYLWSERISMVATLWLMKHGQTIEAIALAKYFLAHPHDLMHKAVGWMLREVGKVDIHALRSFLDVHAQAMPRTMLRYSIEKLDQQERQKYMRTPKQ
ncbi:DNA alkylation repair protein [Candidatus Gracilibacteria bacterium CG17_big_fil_post_rev_8_21_14_2_50_48_13]|nr:MAG: DNA alkylation repair protein [Candidatus Gracilibacteria bacterium CG17_big_fil_post_rev_8_21_14_2_50_48_13]